MDDSLHHLQQSFLGCGRRNVVYVIPEVRREEQKYHDRTFRFEDLMIGMMVIPSPLLGSH